MNGETVAMRYRLWGFLCRYSAGIWAFLGIAVTVAVYYYSTRQPSFHVFVLSDAPVVSVAPDDAKLEIIYDKKNITNLRGTLKVVTIQIANDSSIDLSPDRFKAPVGFRMNADLVSRPTVISPSDAYFIDTVVFETKNQPSDGDTKSLVTIKPFLLKAGKTFLVRLVVYQDSMAHEIQIEPYGGFDGASEIQITSLINRSPGFIEQVLSGSPLVHFARAIGYVAIFILSILTMIFLGFTIIFPLSEWRERKKFPKGHHLADLYKMQYPEPSTVNRWLIDFLKKERFAEILDTYKASLDSTILERLKNNSTKRNPYECYDEDAEFKFQVAKLLIKKPQKITAAIRNLANLAEEARIPLFELPPPPERPESPASPSKQGEDAKEIKDDTHML